MKVVNGNIDMSLWAVLALNSLGFGPVPVDGGDQLDIGRSLGNFVGAPFAKAFLVWFWRTGKNYEFQICLRAIKYITKYKFMMIDLV